MIITIASISASVLLLVLSAVIVSKQRSIRSIVFFLVLLLIAGIELMDCLSLTASSDSIVFKKTAIIFESFLPIVFLYFSLIYAREGSIRPAVMPWGILLAIAMVFPVTVVPMPLSDIIYAPDFPAEKILFLENTGYWFYVGIMFYSILALLNLELTFAASTGGNRWRIKFDIFGISAIMAVLIFYYSQGLLYRTINMDLMPIKSGVLIIASLLIAYSKLFRGNGVRVVVSRYILYRSLTLTLVGVYLVVLGLIGEGMKYFGIRFSRDIMIFIAFVSGIALLLVIFSERLRRRLKVFVNKHFYRHKYDYRNEWLKFADRFAVCRTKQEVVDSIIGTYRETFGLKAGALYMLNKNTNRYTLSAAQNIPESSIEMSVDTPMMNYFKEKGRVYNAFDREYVTTTDEAVFIKETGANLIVPLMDKESVEGFLVLGEQLAKDEFTYEDYDLMKTLAKQVYSVILNMKLSEELSKAREMEAIGKISTFVIHDLKNLVSSLSLIIENADDYIDDPDFQKDMIQSLASTVDRMKKMIARLKDMKEKDALNLKKEDLYSLVSETIKDINTDKIKQYGISAYSMVDKEEIKKVLLNLVLNAIEATDGNGNISVETGKSDMAFIKVTDNGPGMSEEFRKKYLFVPFKTTKKKGLGIGLYQCKQIIEAHKGRIDVQSQEGKGTVFTVMLPLLKDAEYAVREVNV